MKLAYPSGTLFSATLLACLAFGTAVAQPVYRVVGPDGRVSFSDRPPTGDTKATTPALGPADSSPTAALPFELRQIASRYPVTLYSANDCSPCARAVALLSGRGIPFTERSVNTPEDAQALMRLSGEATLPFLTIGAQQLKGFSDVEWHQFLDAAGYPATSRLPSGYRRPPANPLVAAQEIKPVTAAAPPAPEAPAPAAASTPPPVDRRANPAGIVF